MTERLKEFLQQKRWLQLKKTDWIAAALVGVLLLVVAMPSGGTGIHLAENKKEDTAQEKTEQKYEKEDYAEAKELLLRAVGEYPHNLGEGKLESGQENNLYYLLGLVQEKLGEAKDAFESLTRACCGESEPVGMMYYNDQPPEMIYYQGLAYRMLGEEEQAVRRFQKLVDYGREHIRDDVKIDYFAVSLPDLLIFEENLNERNRKHCLFMMSLGLKGLGRIDEAEKCAEELLAMDNAHQEIRVHDL